MGAARKVYAVKMMFGELLLQGCQHAVRLLSLDEILVSDKNAHRLCIFGYQRILQFWCLGNALGI